MGRKVNENTKEKRAKDSKLVENFLIVATLITTASFAAAFTVPGGFNGNEGSKQGMPILLRKAAFKAFMVTNTIAFTCSVTVLLLRVGSLINDSDEKRIHVVAEKMAFFIMYALVAMIIAFATGTYVVLTPYQLGLAIFLCALTIVLPFLGPRNVHRYYQGLLLE